MGKVSYFLVQDPVSLHLMQSLKYANFDSACGLLWVWNLFPFNKGKIWG